MKQVLVLSLMLILLLTACSQVQEQPAEKNAVTDEAVVEGNAYEEVPVQGTEYDIVENSIESADDNVLYSNKFEPNYQLLIGSYKIYEDNGDLVLEFSDDFEVSKSKNINVYLSSIGRPAEARHVWDSRYKIIGSLVKPEGKQKYLIPANTNLIDYKAIVLLDISAGIVHGSSRLK